MAIDPIEAGAWQDPEALDRLREIATTVTASESALTNVTLKLARLLSQGGGRPVYRSIPRNRFRKSSSGIPT